MPKPGASPTWMKLSLDRSGDEIRVSACGSGEEQIATRPLGGGLDAPAMLQFAADVRAAALREKPLPLEVVQRAQAAYHALFAHEIGALFASLRAVASGPLLLRLLVPDAELQSVAWEALCKSGEALGFLATSPDVLPVRRVISLEPWQPREVQDAVRVLAIAPGGERDLVPLREALHERVASGEIEWLEPVTGEATQVMYLFPRLRGGLVPHVLHFLGHGGVDKGTPKLRLADEDGEERWMPVELLAQQLKASFGGDLRLVVLEACEGARPGAFASAAELLGRVGADAVVAHLWPVKADVARHFSMQLYRALTAADRKSGDIALAVNEARRATLADLEGRAEALSPVVYLRGEEGRIFDFKGRKVTAPVVRQVSAATAEIAPRLRSIVGAPFSLLLGDRWRDERAKVDGFRDKLRKELARAADPAPPGLPMSALTQRYELRRGAVNLGAEFQRFFREGAAPPTIVAAIARWLGPGVHTTLLRSPWLEQCLAKEQPDRTIYLLQPGDDAPLVMKREAGRDWEPMDAPPETLDVDRELLVLRPFRGYTPEGVFTRPLLTEDDYYLHVPELWSAKVLPVDLANVILRTLSRRPALILGISMLTGHHRMLLHTLYSRGLPFGSLAVLEQEDGERELWRSGAGLPGEKGGVEVLETDTAAVCAALGAMIEELGR